MARTYCFIRKQEAAQALSITTQLSYYLHIMLDARHYFFFIIGGVERSP
jgi:hypothetical protein